MRTRWILPLSFALVVISAGVALAYFERSQKSLITHGLLNGCVRRFQSVTHGGSNDPVHIEVTMQAMGTNCSSLISTADISGTTYIGLAKLQDGQVAGLCTAETYTFSRLQTPDKIFTYPTPPCGPGEYLAFSCSDVLTERKPVPQANGTTLLIQGNSESDCGSYTTWTWSPMPHPMHD
jgi:hypothetical protein